MNNFGTEYLSYEFLNKYIGKTVNSLYFTSEKYLNEYPQGYTDTENKFPAVIDEVQFFSDAYNFIKNLQISQIQHIGLDETTIDLHLAASAAVKPNPS